MKHFFKPMKNFLNILVAFILFSFCHAQQTELSLNLKKGMAYTQLTDSKATIQQNINGEDISMVMKISGNMTYLVKDIENDVYSMEVKYDRLSISMELPYGTVEYSSEKNDDNDVFSVILRAMKDSPFKIKMTKSGKVVEVKDIDSLFDSAFKQFSNIPENQIMQIKAQLNKAYGEKAFKGNIEMVTAIYPDAAVKEGETWLVETKLESGMSGDVTTTYKYLGEQPDYYLINGESQISTENKDAYVEIDGMPTKYDLSGSMLSVIKVDKTSGWIIEAEIIQEIKGDVYIKKNPDMPEGLKIPMIMYNEMKFTN